MTDPRYPTLRQTFFKGTLRGQIDSVFRTRHENPAKVADFRRAIEDGVITLDLTQLRHSHLQKLMALGITDFQVPPKPPRVNKGRHPIEGADADASLGIDSDSSLKLGHKAHKFYQKSQQL
jgi:hypothetical protein